MRRATVIVVAALSLLTTVVALGAVGVGAAVPTRNVSISATACPGGHIYCYKAAVITVKRGTKVVWKNVSGVPHTVTRCTKTACHVTGGTGTDTKFASPAIGAGRTYAFTFKHVGTYRYYCKFHGYGVMHGTVTVK